jgi:hypothetical protein
VKPTTDTQRELASELREAIYEIRRLRRDNELLSAKVQTMELLGQFLHSRVGAGTMEGHVIDIAWKLEQRVQAVEDAGKKTSAGSMRCNCSMQSNNIPGPAHALSCPLWYERDLPSDRS